MATSISNTVSVQWATALMNLIKLAPRLQPEVDNLDMQFKECLLTGGVAQCLSPFARCLPWHDRDAVAG
jgi:hypothetical protein